MIGGTYTNYPGVDANLRGYLIVYNQHSLYRTMVVYDTKNDINYMRVKNNSGWAAWNIVALDVPTFYKNYSTLALLTSAIFGGAVTNVTSLNANSISGYGLQIFTLTTGGTYTNVPISSNSSTAILIDIRNNAAYAAQIYISIVNCAIYVRTKNNETQYWGWKQITTS